MAAHHDDCRCPDSPHRRTFLNASVAAAAVTLVGAASFAEVASAATFTQAQRDKLSPDEVLALMKKGNKRFSNGQRKEHNYLAQQRQSAGGQYPVAVLLSCIDSRAPAETIMDLRIGDVFNSRVAGNIENPDILASLSSSGNERPKLVIGFAAETENLVEGARAKLAAKGCDWIVANDVSPSAGVFGGSDNTVHLVTKTGVESWPRMSKDAVAEQLAARIRDHLLAVA